jgi:hypothetical protein
MLGQRVAILTDDEQPAGTHLVTFDASGLSGGTYVYRIRSGAYSKARTFILLK